MENGEEDVEDGEGICRGWGGGYEEYGEEGMWRMGGGYVEDGEENMWRRICRDEEKGMQRE